MTSQSRSHETAVSAMSRTHINTPSMLTPNFNNHSTTSVTSEAATFHSAQVAPPTEMDHNDTTVIPVKLEPELSSTVMSRTDSGYEAGCGRRSTSTSSSRSRRPRNSSSSTSPRPANKRASRSATSSTHRTSARPSLQSRYNLSRGAEAQTEAQTPYQFFQFPSLSPPTPPSTSPEVEAPPHPSNHPPLPPATIHYFLLPETRRLEYAAIDAASRGVRGFITRLLPDCILPAEFRRTKFHDGDQDSDAGSVRRYRLSFPDPEEKSVTVEGSQWQDASSAAAEGRKPRPGVWRRVMSFRKT